MPESNDQPEPELTWRVHPAREQPGRAAAAGVVITAIALLAGILYNNPFWSILVAALMVLILQRFYFPSRFTIDDVGIVADYAMRRMRMPWSRARRFVFDAHGGYLSTRARPTLFDSMTGMHLLFDDQRDAIIKSIRKHLARARGVDGPDPAPDQKEPAA